MAKTSQTSWVMLLLCAAVLLVAQGCGPKRVDDLHFRTLQPESAFDRAVASVEHHGRGVYQSDPQRGVVHSNWIDADFGMGIPPRYLWYRYVVTVVPNRADASADVRLSLQAVSCGVFDSRAPDRMAKECGPPEHIPARVLREFERVKAELERDVFRRE